ncbi:Dimethyladenosine transferase (RRNA methylation) [uncultured Sphingopyxis sp.]|uniref:Dimethyladenosine transferase (RRNA methylation) n=1 Tax=uncultured Sphingopyxis sp. TaxID=310581 RepID=A0A1Y5PYP9_9SPHN|nr:class I SAM-dependent methyltransferase [uncultured Sphingopyxis sp.]SBV32354.1 Dimethyladenosine transferase (RRNA methylation) [uncultured Sphingopyxis sp.]
MSKTLDRAVGATAFGADVAGYAAGRLDYPHELFAILAERGGLAAGADVLEIGPGTGQATRELLDAGAARVIAVEPDSDLSRHLCGWGEARLEVVTLPFGPAVPGDGRFDLIVAATSFHWLEAEPALADVRRLLKPGGVFAMWWNVFREPGDDRLFDALFDGLARPPSMMSDQHYSLDTAARMRELAAAGLAGIEHVMLERSIAVTPASLRALFATFSAVRQLPPAVRAARLDAVEEQALYERGERFERVFQTPLYIARAPG